MSKLNTLRKELRLSQSEFAEKLGVSYRAYTSYERGDRGMPIEFLSSLVNLYSVNLNWLIANNGEMFINEQPKTNLNIDEEQFRALFHKCMKEEGFI